MRSFACHRTPESIRNLEGPEGSGGSGGPVCTFRGADAGWQRDGARAQHAGRGGFPVAVPARRNIGSPLVGLGPQRTLQCDLAHAAPVSAVFDAGPRCLAGDPGRGNAGRDDRFIDPAGPCACAHRAGGAAMAAVPTGACGPAVSGGPARRDAAGAASHGASEPESACRSAKPGGCPSGVEDSARARRLPPAGAGAGGGHCRTFGVGQVHARALARRRLATVQRLGEAGRRGTGAVRRCAWAPCWLLAAGGHPFRGHRRAEHRPVLIGCQG